MTPPDQLLEQRLAALSPEKRELVRRKLRSAATAAGPAASVIPRAPRGESPPLSSAQQRLWFLSQLEGPSATYNVVAALRLSGKVDHLALERSMQQIVRRHEVLRANFSRSATGEAEQHIAGEDTASAFRIAVETVRGADARGVEAAMMRQAEAEARRPFDLASDRLLRLTLIQHETVDPLLLLVVHHIVTDGWSMAVMVREVAEVYAGLVSGAPATLPELSIQYADYAAWESSTLAGPAAERSLEWWRETLSGAPPALAIRTDHPRASTPTYRGSTVRFEIDADTMRALRALAERDRVSVFAASLAVTGILLGRYSGQDDVVIGCPLANRESREVQSLIGFFVNTLPVRLRLDSSASFRDLVKQAHATMAGVVAHQELPFERLVDALPLERDLTRSPIYQAVIAYEPADEAVLNLAGVSAKPLSLDTNTAKFEFTFSLNDTRDGCRGALDYNSDLYDEATAQRMVRHFTELLRSAIEDPGAPIADLAMMPAAERRQVLDWSGVVTDYPRHATVAELFAETVAAHPAAVALVQGVETVTYLELDRRASRVAAFLQSLGIGAGSMVGLCSARSIDCIVGMIGILKAGGVYVPIDPAYPESRIAFMLRDTRATVILTDGIPPPALPDGCAAVTITKAEAATGLPLANVRVDPNDAAYVMYTSGSTGQPKGVVVPHRAIVRLVRGTNYFSVSADDTFLQLAQISFDAATFEIWAPLLNGARLAIAPAHTPSLAEIGAVIKEHQVTTAVADRGTV